MLYWMFSIVNYIYFEVIPRSTSTTSTMPRSDLCLLARIKSKTKLHSFIQLAIYSLAKKII